MAERNIVGSLFGLTPEMYQQDLARQQTATNLKAAQLTPGQLAGFYAMEAGTGLGRTTQSLLGIEDPQLKMIRDVTELRSQFDVSTPKGLREFSSALSSRGLTDFAIQAAEKAAEIEKDIGMANRANRESMPEIIRVQQARDDLAKELGANHPRVKELDDYIKRKGQGQQINVGVSTIDKEGNLRKDFLGEVKPFRDPFIAASKIENLLTSESSLADKITRKQWAKLAGDATISNKDTDAVTNFGDLGTRLVGILNQFAEGKYSDAQRQEAVNLARQIKSQSQTQYKDIQSQFQSRAKDAGIPENTLKFIAPELPASAGVSLVVGRQYRDKNGRLATFEGYDTEGKPKFKPAQ